MKSSKQVRSQRILRVFFFIFLILTFNFPPIAKANLSKYSAKQITFTLNDLGYIIDDGYQGVLVKHQYDVNIPKNWSFSESATITIRFSHSPSLNPHSSMAVDWNDIRVASVLLDQSNTDQGSLQIEIPADVLNAGYNKMSVQFYMGIRDDFCVDFDNPALWAVVHNSTSFSVPYSLEDAVVDLHAFHEQLIDFSPIAKNVITLVLPEQPTIDELNAAALVSAKLGQFADWRDLEIRPIALEQLEDQKPTGNVILIASAQHLAEQNSSYVPPSMGSGESFQFRDLSGKYISADAGLFWIQASPYDSKSIWLSVTSPSKDGLEKAARAFATTSVYDRLSGQLGIIQDVPQVNEPEPENQTLRYSLTDLGHQEIVAVGMNEQSTQITFPLQTVFDSLGEATFHLIFSHSAVLNPTRSSLNVLVNNIPVSSITMNKSNTQEIEMDVKIPLRLFRLGDNIITITSSIYVNNASQDSKLYCTDEYYNDSWLTINPNSTLIFPKEMSQPTASLSGFPVINLGDSTLSNMAFIVPDAVDWITSTAVLQVANRIGRTAKGDQLNSVVVPASLQNNETADRPYQIVIGLPSQNQAIMQLNDLLPQPFEEDKVTPKALAGIASISPGSSVTGYIESLFTADGDYRLVLTATSPVGLVWVTNALNTPEIFQDFEGNLAVFSASDNVAFFSIPSTTSLVSDQSPPSVSTSFAQESQHPSWVIYLAVAILVFSLGALLLKRLRKKR